MQSDYTEQDSERARATERSSAGLQTQKLGGPPLAALPQTRGRNNTVALALIAVGLMMLALRVLSSADGLSDLLDSEELIGGMVLFTIASSFLFFSFWRRIYGLLIPGCILAGLSMGVPFADWTDGVSVLWGLALGFMAILVLGRTLFGVQSSWPVFPAVPLFAVGVIAAIAQLPALFAGVLIWLPLLLIGAGLFLGWGRRP